MNTSPKLYKNLVAAVIEVLETSFGKGYYADKVIERVLKSNRKWGSRDRAFIAESSYEIVRWWRLLWTLYDKEPSLKRKELQKLFGLWWMLQGYELPEWDQFAVIRDFNIEKAKMKLPNDTGIRESFPEWLDQLAHNELGDHWHKVAAELNRPTEVMIRANTLKVSGHKLYETLLAEGVETQFIPGSKIGLILKERQNTFRNPSFQNGFFEVQDGGSQLIAPFLEVKPGMRVIDACAGAGGKALHLAAIMENKGSIIAMDVEAWKLNELKKRARRNGVHNIETRHIDSAKVIKRLENSADRLLLDVPCSGTGVIKRNPDTKWKLKPEHLDRVKSIQKEILHSYAKMLKPGGKLVYATCSILRSENEEQVASFIAGNSNYKLLNEQRIDPSEYSDGFYMALIERIQ